MYKLALLTVCRRGVLFCCNRGPVFIVLRTTPREMALIVDAKRGGGTVSLILSRVQTLDYCIYMLSILRFLVLLFEWQKRDSHTHHDYIL
jgi:hypothetical protein